MSIEINGVLYENHRVDVIDNRTCLVVELGTLPGLPAVLPRPLFTPPAPASDAVSAPVVNLAEYRASHPARRR